MGCGRPSCVSEICRRWNKAKRARSLLRRCEREDEATGTIVPLYRVVLTVPRSVRDQVDVAMAWKIRDAGWDTALAFFRETLKLPPWACLPSRAVVHMRDKDQDRSMPDLDVHVLAIGVWRGKALRRNLHGDLDALRQAWATVLRRLLGWNRRRAQVHVTTAKSRAAIARYSLRTFPGWLKAANKVAVFGPRKPSKARLILDKGRAKPRRSSGATIDQAQPKRSSHCSRGSQVKAIERERERTDRPSRARPVKSILHVGPEAAKPSGGMGTRPQPSPGPTRDHSRPEENAAQESSPQVIRITGPPSD